MKRNSIFYFVALLFATFIFTGCGQRYSKNETQTYTVSTVNKTGFKFANTNGQVTITKGSVTDEVKIVANITESVRKKDLDKPIESVKVELDTTGDVIDVHTKIDLPKKLFRFGSKLKVDYEIFVPENISVNVVSVNGKITVSEVTNNIDLMTTNGSVTLTNSTGNVEVRTVNGKITCNTYDTKGLKLETTNGSIDVAIPKTLNARVYAKVVNGKITFKELDLKVISDDKRNFSGELGNPDDVNGVNISVETINGSITFTESKTAGTIELQDTVTDIEKAEQELKEAEELLKQKKQKLEELKKQPVDTVIKIDRKSDLNGNTGL